MNNNTELSKKDIKLICLYLFIFAIAVRGGYYVGFMDNPFFDYVSPAFDQINFDKAAIGFANGSILASGGAEGYAPLYKYFLGIIYWIFGRNFFAIWAVQFFIGAGASVFMFLITLRFFNKWVAIICSIFYAMYGPNIFYEGKLIRESLTEFLAIILFYYLLRYKEEPRLKYAILSGAFLSLLIQSRPNMLFIIPFGLYYLFWVILKGLSVKLKVKHVLIFMAILAVVGTPLMVRTVIVHKRFVLYDTSGPQTLLAGNLPEYEGVGWNDAEYIDHIWGIIRSYNGDTVSIINHIFKRVCASPIDYISLYARKIYWFLNNYEYPANVNYYLYQDFSPVLKNPLSNFSLLVSLAIAGMVLTCKDYRRYLLIYLFIAGLTLSVIIFYPVSRFRIAVVPFFIPFAAYSIYYVFLKIWQKRVVMALACIIPVALMTYFLRTPEAYSYKIRHIDYGNMAIAYLENKKKYSTNKAEEYLIKSWNQSSMINMREREKGGKYLKNVVSKDLVRLYLYLTAKAFVDKNYNDAIVNGRKAVRLEYANLEAHKLLSNCYFQKNDYLDAINEIKICAILKPLEPEHCYNLAVLYYKYLHDYVNAESYLQRALDINNDIGNPNNPDWKGLEKAMAGIVPQIHEGIETNRNQIEILWNEAMSGLEQGDFDQAISNCKKIIDMDYRNINAHNLLAYSYGMLKQYNESISEYIDILTIDPDIPEVHYNLFELYSNGAVDEIKAMYHLEQTLKLNPNQKDCEELKKKLYDLQFWSVNLRQISL